MRFLAGPPSQRVLVLLLLVLAAVFAVWFARDPRPLQAAAVFSLPPLLLAGGVAFGRRAATFWSGVFALGWFCHGVMLAWSRADGRAFALAEVALALGIVFASSWPGLQARFGGRGRGGAKH